MTKRQPRGVPVGGQFAANDHDEAVGSLAANPDDLVDQVREGRGDYLAALSTLEEMAANEYRHEASDLADQVREQEGDYLVALEDLRDLIPDDEVEPAGDPNIVGRDPGRYETIAAYLDGYEIEKSTPTRTQLKSALNDPDGKKAKGVARIFEMDALNSGDHDVTAPKDGTPITVISRGGRNSFRVRSGNVIIVADDISGTSVEAEDGATVTVLARPHQEVSVRSRAGSRVNVVAGAASTGTVEGEGIVNVIHPDGVQHDIDNKTSDGFLPVGDDTPF